jgi:hypothetical protein
MPEDNTTSIDSAYNYWIFRICVAKARRGADFIVFKESLRPAAACQKWRRATVSMTELTGDACRILND